MNPTAKLRFIERDVVVPHKHIPDVSEIKPMRILQQWWEDNFVVLAVHVTDKDGNPMPPPLRGEWRDVPLERDE